MLGYPDYSGYYASIFAAPLMCTICIKGGRRVIIVGEQKVSSYFQSATKC